LRTKNWREADAETQKVMLQAADRAQEGWLDEASLKRFPCQDLQTIDRLWSKYSDGRFGFTAQKSVWETCYRPTTYKEGWNNFKEQVGWRKKGAIDGYEHDIQKIEGGISMRTILWDVMVPDEERTLKNLGELPSWTFLIQPYEQRDILERHLPELPLVVGSSRHPEYWLMSRIQSCKL
jgi:hypothetical protein